MEVKRSVEMIFWSISTNYVSELKFYPVTPGSAVRLTAMETCWTSRRQKWLQKVFYDQLLRKLWGQTGIWTYKQACYGLLCGFQHVKFKTCLIWDNVKQSCQPSCWAISHRKSLNLWDFYPLSQTQFLHKVTSNCCRGTKQPILEAP